MTGWLLHILGLDSASGPAYLFWSGALGDAGLFGGIALLAWHHSCHQAWCFRYVRHLAHDGLRHCRKHPGSPPPPDPTAELLARIDWLGHTIMAQTQASVAHSKVMADLAEAVRAAPYREGS